MSSDTRPRRRTVTDATTLRAMAHPLRLRMLALLTAKGPLTATEVGEELGESPANCSFHLRTLAKYGFAEEAPGGTGRRRPWRAVAASTSIHEDDLDADALQASRALTRTMRTIAAEDLEQWYATRNGYPKPWRGAAFENMAVAMLTAEELKALGEGIDALLAPYIHRGGDPRSRPDGSTQTMLMTTGFPTRLPAAPAPPPAPAPDS